MLRRVLEALAAGNEPVLTPAEVTASTGAPQDWLRSWANRGFINPARTQDDPGRHRRYTLLQTAHAAVTYRLVRLGIRPMDAYLIGDRLIEWLVANLEARTRQAAMFSPDLAEAAARKVFDQSTAVLEVQGDLLEVFDDPAMRPDVDSFSEIRFGRIVYAALERATELARAKEVA